MKRKIPQADHRVLYAAELGELRLEHRNSGPESKLGPGARGKLKSLGAKELSSAWYRIPRGTHSTIPHREAVNGRHQCHCDDKIEKFAWKISKLLSIR